MSRPFLTLSIATLLGIAHVRAADSVTFTGSGIFPESITSLDDGTLFIGSATRTIYRAAPGATEARPWVEIESVGPRSTFGVLAHAPSKTSRFATTSPWRRTARSTSRTPAPRRSCDSRTARLRCGRKAGPFGDRSSVLDGIAVLGSRVIVNTLKTHRLIAVEIDKDGSAGAITDIVRDQPLNSPDGMRAVSDTTLVIGENRRPGRVVAVDGIRGSLRELATELPGRLRRGHEVG